MFNNLGKIISPLCDLEKVAVIDLSNASRSYTYKQVDQQADAVARGLATKNINVGEKISILSDNSVDVISVFFGTLRLGAIPVLINTNFSDEQIKIILSETNSKILFVDRDKKFDIPTIHFNSDFKEFLNYGSLDCYKTKEDDIAFILYTSGTHGSPKAACITHRGHIWALERNISYDKNSSERISLISAPLYHSNGLSTFEGSFAGNSQIILLPKFNPLGCIKAIEKYQVNTMYCVPSMLAMIIREDYIKQANLNSLKLIRSASSHFSQNLFDSVKKYFPNANVLNSYGLTEVGPALFGPHPDKIPRPVTSVGYPAKGIEYRIVDGVLQIKSPSMMYSYYHSQNNTNSFTDDGFFITNDLFTVDEHGFYYFLGRNDDMFKCGGNSVFPKKVEEILESHPSVISAVVLGFEDEIKGHKPYAFVIVENHKSVSEKELKKYVLDRGPAFQHPRKIWFLDEFPLLAGNKIDKEKLKILYKNEITAQLR